MPPDPKETQEREAGKGRKNRGVEEWDGEEREREGKEGGEEGREGEGREMEGTGIGGSMRHGLGGWTPLDVEITALHGPTFRLPKPARTDVTHNHNLGP
jgi:hypothetical protein